MNYIIEKIKKEKQLCEIYTDISKSEVFSVGYILACDSEYVLVELIDIYGNQDGFCCFNMDNIYKIKQKTRYLV